MDIQKNIVLAPYTTFKIGGPAAYFCVVKDQFDALEAYEFAQKYQLKTFVLGGGSNLLVSDNGFNGLVIHVAGKGIEIVNENSNEILLKVSAGEVWDEVVGFAVKNNWWGMENLSHIPGSAGAIAVQNVGAYGQEAKNIIDSVTVFDKDTRQIINIKNADCGFGYRQSIFNSTAKGKYIIFDVIFKLQKNGEPNLSYRDLSSYFSTNRTLSVASNATSPPSAFAKASADKKGENGKVILSLGEIRKAIISIRDKKFPFPVEAKKGNAGSFFKNPIITQDQLKQLEVTISANFGEVGLEKLRAKVFADKSVFKIPAAFLIDICGFKGLTNGGAAINGNQPLVIINQTGNATAQDVLNLAATVINTVKAKTGLRFKTEPELIGFTPDELKGVL